LIIYLASKHRWYIQPGGLC